MTTALVIDYFPITHTAGRVCQNGRVMFARSRMKLHSGRAALSTGLGQYYLADELHEWLKEIDPTYFQQVSIGKQWIEDLPWAGTRRDVCAFTLVFKDNTLATMFKLRWHGSEGSYG